MIKKVLFLTVFLTSCATLQPKLEPRVIAEKLVGITSEDSEKIARVTMQAAMHPLIQNLKDQGHPATTIIEVNQIIDEFITEFVNDPSLKSQTVDLYVGEFTGEELKAMLDFYETPVGKKTLEKTPIITQKSVDIGLILVQKYQDDFAKKLDQVLEKSNCDKCQN